MNLLIEDAIERGAFEDILSAREQLEATLMDLITPKPSTVNREFYKRYQLSYLSSECTRTYKYS
ncbi:hypothetical protein QS428_06580 [Staphylococcus pseudintermedius]|nr:hypothetical protein QS428_06580 [Staphylococcus pseudintermedius]